MYVCVCVSVRACLSVCVGKHGEAGCHACIIKCINANATPQARAVCTQAVLCPCCRRPEHLYMYIHIFACAWASMGAGGCHVLIYILYYDTYVCYNILCYVVLLCIHIYTRMHASACAGGRRRRCRSGGSVEMRGRGGRQSRTQHNTT